MIKLICGASLIIANKFPEDGVGGWTHFAGEYCIRKENIAFKFHVCC